MTLPQHVGIALPPKVSNDGWHHQRRTLESEQFKETSMNEQSSQFVGNIPDNYDQGLGPHIFHDYAEDLAKRAAAANAIDVLELAAGTGIVSRRLRDALPAAARLVVTDLNPPMLAVAKGKFSEGEAVEFAPADAMALPFEDAAFDLIVCQFGVMFFPDKRAAFAQAKRVLRSGGSYLFNVWGDMASNPFSEIAQNVGVDYFPDDPPGFYRVPFGYSDTDAVVADMEAAGFQEITRETVAFDKQVADWSLFARGLVYGNPLFDEIQSRGGVDPDEVMRSIRAALQDRFGQQPASMPLLATVYNGRAP